MSLLYQMYYVYIVFCKQCYILACNIQLSLFSVCFQTIASHTLFLDMHAAIHFEMLTVNIKVSSHKLYFIGKYNFHS